MNEFKINRNAHVHVVHPGNAAGTGRTTNTGVILPKGAIITGIRLFSGGGITGAASLSNAILGMSIGSVGIISNNNIQSVKILQTTPVALTLAAAGGVVVPATGNLIVEFVSAGTAATGVTADFDIYVDYLFVTDHD